MYKSETLYQKALKTEMHSRFINLESRLGRIPTDPEVIEEARYQIECIPYTGFSDESWERKAIRQMKMLIRSK